MLFSASLLNMCSSAAHHVGLLLALRIVSELRDAEDVHQAPKILPEGLHEGLVERCHPRVPRNDQGLPLRPSCQQKQQALAIWTSVLFNQSQMPNRYLLKVASAAL